jgi:alginate O-acetyltransferase complex protein AlgI
MMGFTYSRNFNYPYMSRSVTEFWRRWHMSLSSFFRDYVYIPLGGSRVSRPRWMLNIMVVWGLTGIWHGAAWNFLLWGLYYGVLLMAEKLFLLRVLDRLPRAIGHIYCVIVFFFGWLLFSVTGLGNVAQWAVAMFGAYGFSGTSTVWELQSWGYVSLLPVFIVGALPVFPYIRKRIEVWATGNNGKDVHAEIIAAPERGNDFVPPCQVCIPPSATPLQTRVCVVVNIMCDLALLCVFVVSCRSVVSGGYNPFIYFQF